MAARDIVDVLLRLSADTRQAQQAIKDTTKETDKLNESLKTLGAGLAAAFTGAAAKNALDFMAEIASVADRIGLTTDALQELRFVGQQVGLQYEETDDILQSFVERLGDAQGKTGEAFEALNALGVTLERTTGGFKSTEQVLYEVSDAFADMDDAQQRVFRAQQLFESEQATKFLNAMTQGSEAIRRMRRDMREMGLVLDESLIRGAQEASRQMGTLAFILRAQFNRGVAEAAPLIVKVGEGLEFFLTQVGRTYNQVLDLVGANEDVKASLDDVAASTHQVSQAIKDMNKDVQASMEETQQALSGEAPKEVETLADAAAIRLDAARAISNRDFDLAAEKLKEYNRALVTLRDSGKESTGVLRGMFLMGQSLAGTLARQSALAPPGTTAAMTPLGQPGAEMIPMAIPGVGPSNVGTAGLGRGERGEIQTVPGPDGVGTQMQFVPSRGGPVDERTVADIEARRQRQAFQESVEQAELRRAQRGDLMSLGGQVSTLLAGTGLQQAGSTAASFGEELARGFMAGLSNIGSVIAGSFRDDVVWSPRATDSLTESLAQAERKHGPVN